MRFIKRLFKSVAGAASNILLNTRGKKRIADEKERLAKQRAVQVSRYTAAKKEYDSISAISITGLFNFIDKVQPGERRVFNRTNPKDYKKYI